MYESAEVTRSSSSPVLSCALVPSCGVRAVFVCAVSMNICIWNRPVKHSRGMVNHGPSTIKLCLSDPMIAAMVTVVTLLSLIPASMYSSNRRCTTYNGTHIRSIIVIGRHTYMYVRTYIRAVHQCYSM